MLNFSYSKIDRDRYFEKEDVEYIDTYQQYLAQSTTKPHYYLRQGMHVSKRERIPFHLKIPFASSSLQFPLCHICMTDVEVIKASPTIISLLQRAGIARRIQGYQFRWQIFIGSSAGRRQRERRAGDSVRYYDRRFQKGKAIELSFHDVSDAHKRERKEVRRRQPPCDCISVAVTSSAIIMGHRMFLRDTSAMCI